MVNFFFAKKIEPDGDVCFLFSMFWEEIVADHFKVSTKPSEIFIKYGFNQSFDEALRNLIKADLQTMMLPNDCVSICAQYIKLDDYHDDDTHYHDDDTSLLFSQDNEVSSVVLAHWIAEEQILKKHWVYKLVLRKGICNAVITMSHRLGIRCAESYFVRLLVEIAKNYGETRFLQVLRLSLISKEPSLYAEGVNRVAQILNKTTTRCLLGSFCCFCFEEHDILYSRLKTLKQKYGYDKEAKKQILIILKQEFPDVTPILSRVDDDDCTTMPTSKKQRHQ